MENPDFNALHKTHEELLELVKKLPTDYEPFGKDDRGEDWSPDCSCGCRHYLTLEGKLGADWGVCTNPNSPRLNLLTFEHQGCRQFENSLQIDEWFEQQRDLQNQDPKHQELKERILKRAENTK